MSHRIKNIFLTLVPVIILGAALLVVGAMRTEADVENTVQGYAWASNIGWISLNNCDDVNDPDTCGPIPYGVSYDPTSDSWTGTGWNDNIGWINFGVSGPGSGQWAKAVVGGQPGSGGWDGWISLDRIQLPSDESGTFFTDFGWNGENDDTDAEADMGIGWMDYRWAQYVVPEDDNCIYNAATLRMEASPSADQAPFTSQISWWSENGTFDACTASHTAFQGPAINWDGDKSVPSGGSTELQNIDVAVGASYLLHLECNRGDFLYCADEELRDQPVGEDTITVTGQCAIDLASTPTIAWYSTGDPIGCTTSWNGQRVENVGQEQVSLANGTTFTVSCNGGTISDSFTVPVFPECVTSPIVIFGIDEN